jgi:hypothetical protein
MNDKNKLKQRLAAALPFAHLLGLGPVAASGDDGEGNADDDSKQRDGESDEDYAKRMEDEERKQRDDESDEDYAKRMEEAGAADDDDTETDKEQAARVKERARCAAIFGAASAGTRPDVAAHLAFSTDMPAAEAIKMLNSFAGDPAAARSLSSRMARVQTKNPGAGAAPGAASPAGNSAAAVAAQIIAAGKKRRGEK